MTAEQQPLARYLLGRLPAAEEEKITDRLFGDEAFAEELEAAERDLLDAYARGELSRQDAVAVRARLLTSEAQREKLMFARSLNRHRGRAGTPRRYLAAAAAILVPAGLGIAAGYLLQANRQLRDEIALLQRESRLEAQGRPAAASTISFLLSPVERAGGEQTLEWAPAVQLVRLDFELPADAEGRCTVRLATQSGRMIAEQRSAAIERVGEVAFVSLWVPAQALPAGSYEASVEFAAAGRTRVDYSFRHVAAAQ